MGKSHSASDGMVNGLRRLVMDTAPRDVADYRPGLEDVIAAETTIAAESRKRLYRGYGVEELAGSASFLEVVWLLLHGSLPTRDELADFQSILTEASPPDDSVLNWIDSVPFNISASDLACSAIGFLAHFDQPPDVADTRFASIQQLLAQLPIVLATRFRRARGLDDWQLDPALGYTGSLIAMFADHDPSELEERALEAWLILYAAEEFCESSFAARVLGSAAPGVHSAVSAAAATLQGSEFLATDVTAIHQLLTMGSRERSGTLARAILQQNGRMYGFGDPPGDDEDPDGRVTMLTELCRRVAEERGFAEQEANSAHMELQVARHNGSVPQLIWPAVRLVHYLGFDEELFFPLLVIARLAGWSAHAMEQARLDRPIRPAARYVGPARRPFVPLSRRG